MNIHPIFWRRLEQAISLLSRGNESTAEILNHAADRQMDGVVLSPESAFYLGLNPNGECIDPETRRSLGRNISDLTPAETAGAIVAEDPTILDPAHITMATSLHRICNHDPSAVAHLIHHLDDTAERTIYRGRPSVPAIRWAFRDGSGLVQYGYRITAAVHESRLAIIRHDYNAHAHSSLEWTREAFLNRGHNHDYTYLAPDPAFAPADDGTYSHQAALPSGATRCWCGRHQGVDVEASINRLI